MSDELREQIAAALAKNGIGVENVASIGNADQWLPDYDLADALIAAVPALSGDSGPGLREALKHIKSADSIIQSQPFDESLRKAVAGHIRDALFALAAAPVPDTAPLDEERLANAMARVPPAVRQLWTEGRSQEAAEAIVARLADEAQP